MSAPDDPEPGSAFVIYQGTITDPDKYMDEYVPPALEAIHEHGGRPIARESDPELLEGDRDFTRMTIVEFPSVEAAREWYHSEKYTAARKLREEATSDGRMLVLPRYEHDPGGH